MFNNKGKAAVLLLTVLMVIALGMGAGVYYLLQKEKAVTADLRLQLDQAKADYKAKQQELEDASNRITKLEANLSESRLQITDLTSNLEKEISSKSVSLKEIEKLKADLSKEIQSKAGIQKSLEDSAGTIKSLQARLKEMESKINSLEGKKKDLEEKVKSLENKAQNVELGKIVVGPEGAGAAGKETTAVSASGGSAAKIEGKIAVVNKDYNFVVINVGSRDGVVVGSIFNVTHNNKNAGDIKVEKVHENMSAAGFVDPDIKDKISEGDKVLLKK